ncbi:MAG: monofunctional biosynthetic peptidoglycan transglycosylase [Deltaproteobacteria bacterium]|nr:monofunctional biosynthetic peptidoglycan transglycosylase [Deltaproteobacteria bacterium]
MKKLLYISAVFAALAAILYFLVLPDVSRLRKENPKKTSMMEYNEARKKKAKRHTVYQVWSPLANVSPYLVKAVVIAEDDKFYSHEGFDFEGMREALEKNIKAKKFKAGGSTISQQLVKNLYLTPQRSLLRKFREFLITWKMERTLSKRRIMELYLNVAEWGDGIYGAEAASRHYFNKTALYLTPEQAARLVAVLPNPIRYNAAGDQQFVTKRAAMIYDIMVKRGIVIEDYDEEDEGGTDGAASPLAAESQQADPQANIIPALSPQKQP